eukprot:Hpha_TRINITY_DN26476_c0_g1::TRINITY_DN26476_c0_g1_i1::g.33994::m.33994/K08869/ADCK, ABC1; aarF domain-containing kinase
MWRRSRLFLRWGSQLKGTSRPRVAPQHSRVDVPLVHVPSGFRTRVSRTMFLLMNPRLILSALVGLGALILIDHAHYGHAWTVRRCLRSAYLAATIMTYYWYMEKGDMDEVDRIVTRSRCHEVASEAVLEHMLTLGGVYLKIGQIMSTLSHVLPLEWCATMKACLDHTNTMDFWEVDMQFQKAFEHGGLESSSLHLFREFATVPAKAASLAQVHLALGEDGTRLAVKVKRREVDNEVQADARLMRYIAELAERWWPEFSFGWLARYFEETVKQELDFVVEAENGTRFREEFADWEDVTAPRVWRELTTRDILVMDYVEGFNVDEKAQMGQWGIKTGEVARRLAEVVAEQVFGTGRVHADPHPANIFVQPLAVEEGAKNWRLCWLDHGLYQRLSRSFQLQYARLWVALAKRDRSAVETACREIGVGNWKVLATVLTSHAHVQGTSSGVLTKQDFYIPRTLSSETALGVLEILGQVPEEMVLALKCNDLLRSVQHDLGLPVNYFSIMAHRAQRLLNEEAVAGLSGRARSRVEKEGIAELKRLEDALKVLK